MNPCEQTTIITTIACVMFDTFSKDEIALLSAQLVQLGDTLAAMLARDEYCSNLKNKDEK